MTRRSGYAWLIALLLSGGARAQTPTCNLTDPPCSGAVACRGCTESRSVGHESRQPCNRGGSFDLSGTGYEDTCLGTLPGSSCAQPGVIPPLRFWELLDYAGANSGCADPLANRWLASATHDLGLAGAGGRWLLYDASWAAAGTDGCPGFSGSAVAEISFADPAREGTPDHRAYYLVTTVPGDGSGGFDFDDVADGSGCAPGDVAVAEVGGLEVVSSQMAGCRRSPPCPSDEIWAFPVFQRDYSTLDVRLLEPTPRWSSDQGANRAPGLIAGYQIVYTERRPDETPLSSDATLGDWRPIRDPADLDQALGVVRTGTSTPVRVAIPSTWKHTWLGTRLVYADPVNRLDRFDPTTTSGPLLVSPVSRHLGPVRHGYVDPYDVCVEQDDRLPQGQGVPAGTPLTFTYQVYEGLGTDHNILFTQKFAACIDLRDFDPVRDPSQVVVAGTPGTVSWFPADRRLEVRLDNFGGFITVTGLRAGNPTARCCNQAEGENGYGPWPALDVETRCGASCFPISLPARRSPVSGTAGPGRGVPIGGTGGSGR